MPQAETSFGPTKLGGAKFDEKTVLPFDRSETALRGMLQIVEKIKN